jgi:diguanylate cyclase (GGDEF)-like protein
MDHPQQNPPTSRPKISRDWIDAAIMLSIGLLGAGAAIHFNAFEALYSFSRENAGWHLDDVATIGVFVGVSLSGIGVRRLTMQWREDRKRLTAERHIRSLGLRDPLTGLANRRCFELELDATLTDAAQTRVPVNILLMDLNGFERLNNSYGLAGGNIALVAIAQRLRERVGVKGRLARFGADEFALALVGAQQTEVETVAREMIDCLREPITISNGCATIRAALGIAECCAEPLTVEEMLRRAHVALSRAKSHGASYAFFGRHSDLESFSESQLAAELKNAVGTSAIRPNYQPIIALETGRIVGFEALGRWNHPERGPIPPTVFIPIAERVGLSDELTGQLFGEACRDAKQWPDDLFLAFNFSATQLRDPNFAATILDILDEIGFPPSRLEVEITEEALVEDLDTARQVLAQLRTSGVRIAMDDFGTGYSSLYFLRELRFDKLKIDRSFVQSIANPESRVIVQAIVGMSTGLNLKVTAEGVETPAQAAAVLEVGAQYAQGFLFGHPMPADEALRLMAATNQIRLAA